MEKTINAEIDLVFSPHDERQSNAGWYFQNYDLGKTSQLFKTEDEAERALKEGAIHWE